MTTYDDLVALATQELVLKVVDRPLVERGCHLAEGAVLVHIDRRHVRGSDG